MNTRAHELLVFEGVKETAEAITLVFDCRPSGSLWHGVEPT